MNFQLRMLIAAPIMIAAICARPSYALETDSESAYQKGLALYSKSGIEKNSVTAAVYFKEAAEQGHLDAAFSLGVLYQNGEGVPTSSQEAIKWYTKAADQNHAKAQFN
ncbi:MAG TPA: tetratricopeptide repeat protein [Gammaproteobacteria bacterium]|nr:tetratricopeptide repeat protein [Gammaproteobacteria bacterium]